MVKYQYIKSFFILQKNETTIHVLEQLCGFKERSHTVHLFHEPVSLFCGQAMSSSLYTGLTYGY